MKHVQLTWEDLNGEIAEIARQMQKSSWKPDYIVGITRGGLVAATMLSHYLGIRLHTLNVALRDINEPGPESNCWMAEDAFGYSPPEERVGDEPFDAWKRKKILIVDDINDSGATIAWIKKDWQSSCLPKHEQWKNVWNESVRFAVITNNLGSKEKVDYSGTEFSKDEANDYWFVYPWEQWWK